ncbi:MAG: tRNA (cytidine(34)-2'-O)-methyltransferase [Elusimicrobia bacterium]|nr:tRNA (cytidine(34)-2'-O)-methyltransferase [Elusimicrobiota bacterium]
MNVVLLEPEIHFNTGNIGRTCVGTGTALHLVGRLGFRLDDKEIRRSGLDYWVKLDLRLHADFSAFMGSIKKDAALFFFSAEAVRSFWEGRYPSDAYLIFGKESTGLPQEVRERYAQRLYRIPFFNDIRSYNLSTTAGVVLFEALRQNGWKPS